MIVGHLVVPEHLQVGINSLRSTSRRQMWGFLQVGPTVQTTSEVSQDPLQVPLHTLTPVKIKTGRFRLWVSHIQVPSRVLSEEFKYLFGLAAGYLQPTCHRSYYAMLPVAVQTTTDRLCYAADDCEVTGNISEVWKVPCWKPTRWIQISGVSGTPFGTPFLGTVLYLWDFLAIMPMISFSGTHQIPHARYMFS